VISCANPIDTLEKLLDDPGLNGSYSRQLSGMEKSISAFQVYLGLKLPAKELGMGHFMFSLNGTYDQQENYDCSLRGDYERCSLAVVDHSQLEPELVPPGKGSLLIMSLDSYANWSALTEDEYRRKKIEVADKLIKRAQEYLPGLSGQIEVMEAATPITVRRYGTSPEGAIYGFAQTPEQALTRRLPQKTRVKGLFLAGAWTQPGAGIHSCLVSGIEAAGLALRYLKKHAHYRRKA
jgi:prolycopene isomerase